MRNDTSSLEPKPINDRLGLDALLLERTGLGKLTELYLCSVSELKYSTIHSLIRGSPWFLRNR